MQMRGFTLLEALVSLALVALLASLATPAFGDLIRNNRMTSSLNRFVSTLQLARSAAVTSGWSVVLCKSGDGFSCTSADGWEQGWMVFEDRNNDRRCDDSDTDLRCDNDHGAILWQETRPGTAEMTLRGSGNTANRVVFFPTGFARGYAGTLTLCDARGLAAARGVVLSVTGRPRVATNGDNLRCPE